MKTLSTTAVEYVGSVEVGTIEKTEVKGWIAPSITSQLLTPYIGDYIKMEITIKVLERYEGKVTRKGVENSGEIKDI